MYNLLEYSDNYFMRSKCLWNFYWDEINNDENKNDNANNRINSNKAIASKFFKYKAEIIGRTPDGNNILDREIVVPMTYLKKFFEISRLAID